MRFTIQNPYLTVEVDSLGAQLASIRTPDETEYLWQGDPRIWARRAPLLFPLVGRLREERYLLDGAPYSIPIHGFARNMEFTLVQHSSSSLSLRLTDTEETRRAYPFSFALTVTYTLAENRLIKSHLVENRSQREMLYELGGHDGFRAPLETGVPMSSYSIRLPGLSSARFYGMNDELMLTPLMEAVPFTDGALPLTPSTFHLDTMILDCPPQAQAVLTDDRGRPRVTLTFPDFPYLGIWTTDKPFDTGYVCIEPWSSLPDAVFVGPELSDKAGIRRLPGGGSEVLTYTTTIHPLGKEG